MLGDRQFATWVTDDAVTGRLLTMLLDPYRTGADLRDDALAWADEQDPVLSWLEAADGQVHLAMVNRSTRPVVALFAWLGRDDIPIADDLAPGALTPVVIDRSVEGDDGAETTGRAGVGVDALRITVRDRTYLLPVGPIEQPAMPPAAFRLALRSPLTLADLSGPIPVSPWWQTTVELRMIERRWEVFFECRRPQRGVTPLPPLPAAGAASWLPAGSEAVRSGVTATTGWLRGQY